MAEYYPESDEEIETSYHIDEELCPEGYAIDECCNCVWKVGVELCEFNCPFGGIPRCSEEQAKECKEIRNREFEEMASGEPIF